MTAGTRRLVAWGMAGALAAIAAGALLWSGPLVPANLEPLRKPRIATMPAKRMLWTEARGETAAQAAQVGMSRLFGVYYRLSGAPWRMIGAPRGRWRVDDRGGWTARIGIPVPEAVNTLPEGADADGLRLGLWEYGEVVEMLHVGSYDSEAANVEALKAFIAASGLTPSDDHEEEYVRGPGLFGAGNPQRYLTILRYRVKR